jgi:hypothetical protein
MIRRERRGIKGGMGIMNQGMIRREKRGPLGMVRMNQRKIEQKWRG